MNEFETKSEVGTADDVRGLRLLVAAAILLVCVFIGCIDVTLRREAIVFGTQLEGAQKNWDNYEKNEQKVEMGKINRLFTSLNEYAKTHPDYQPLIQQADHIRSALQGTPANK